MSLCLRQKLKPGKHTQLINMKKLPLLTFLLFIVSTTYAKSELLSITSVGLNAKTSSNSISKGLTSTSRLVTKASGAAVLNPTPSASNILFVKKGATGNGSSWANALGEVGDALKWANENKTANAASWATTSLEIWVAKGVYKPMYSPEDGVNYGTNQGRANAFLMMKDVKIYGNFSGTESALSDRDLANTANKTTLSGDLNNNDGANFANISDNSYNVVVSLGDVSAALIDGFTITGGYANQSYLVFINTFYTARNIGAGILVDGSSPRLRNLIIEKNKATGDGVLSLKYSSSVLENVTIQNNAARNGAGVYIGSSVINFHNIVIRNNKATKNGGAIHIETSSKLKMVNGLIVNNSAMRGGGISSLASSSSLTNVTMSNNTTSFEGGGIYNTANSNTEVRNSIIFGNKKGVNWNNIFNDGSGDTADSKYSLVQGETTSLYTDAANYNLAATTDPLFNDVAIGDYTLKPSSPVIEKGSNSLHIGALATDNDLAGNRRLKGANIDMGAYEDTANQFTPTSGVLYVNKTVLGGDGTGSSWANAIPELADALLWANVKSTAWTTANPLNIYVAKGTYKPMYSPEDGVNFGSNKGRDNTFLMVNNVKLYGGFIGTETAITNRVLTVNGIGNGTILSGDLNGDDIYDANGRPIGVTNEDNAYHVIVAANNTTAVITEIDGFEIKGGNADGNSFIHVKALAVRRYYGGAIYSFSNAIFFNGVSTVNLTNSSLSGNTAWASASSTASGGAIYSRSTSAASTVSLTNSNLSGNSAFSSASFAYGGGIYSYSNSTSSIVSLINSSVSGNTASSSSFSLGGGIYSSSSNAASTVSLTNSSLSDNAASNGGGICSYANSAALNDVKLVNSTLAANNGVSFILFSNGIKSFKAHNTVVYGNQGSIELTDPNSGSPMGSAGAITKDIQYSLVQGEGNTANGNLERL